MLSIKQATDEAFSLAGKAAHLADVLSKHAAKVRDPQQHAQLHQLSVALADFVAAVRRP